MDALVDAVTKMCCVKRAAVRAGELDIVPTEAGWELLARSGKEALVRELHDRLPTVLVADPAPERWRFVRRLSGSWKARAGRPLHPRWDPLDRTAASWRGKTIVTNDLAVLEGHFPDEPIVPGLAQLMWAEALSRRLFPDHASTGEVRNLKFRQPIVPGVRIELDLVHEARRPSRIAFQYASQAGTHSRGVIVGV